ncbi:MAG: glutathione S-transferase [Acetobacteraceae bacterium]
MPETILTISSRNYSSWSLRGWLLARMSGLPFEVKALAADDAAALDELMLRSSSILVPNLLHDGILVWDTLAIAEYLHEVCPQAGMFPADRAARARCRSISGEMHSGFGALRSALPMNLRAHRPGFRILSAARMDIERILTIWRDCLAEWKGPWLFGEQRCAADAMYAPVVTRLLTYDVTLDAACTAYCERTMAVPDMQDWVALAKNEVEELAELDVEF